MAPASTSSTSQMSVVAVLLLLLPIALADSALHQLILGACKTVGGGSTYVGIEFCEDALNSVAVGSGVDLDYQLLGGIAVGLLADNATSTKTKIDSLLKAEDKAAVSRCLLSCQSLYGGILDGGPACTAAVKAKKFGDATAILEKAAAAAKECKDGFGKSNVTSLLTAEDGNAFELAKLGVGLLRFA
uniref:Uncharacterized protein n=1 Tax=Avena sativa TaxID=4498 RepID=A0ACD5X396_AVESA